MKNYGICYNKTIENSAEIKERLKNILDKNTVNYEIFDIDNMKSDIDFVFVIGGDGTILKAARFFAQYKIPIFGINRGRLGFLSQTTTDNIETSVEQILSGNYKIEDRMMLTAQGYTALNDFVVKGEECSRTSRFSLEINGKFVCEYLADGIIVSTPTGSTAYGMAAGGPVLTPQIEAITIVPICPHTFSARPIVVSSNDEIKLLNSKQSKYNVSADGQIVFVPQQDLVIKKSENMAALALLNQNDFYSVLRNKLKWGISPAKM
ncbi:MAG: NAD(+)/NADH kinase [Candidatus Gastranaerophilaceae bacterium]